MNIKACKRWDIQYSFNKILFVNRIIEFPIERHYVLDESVLCRILLESLPKSSYPFLSGPF